MSRIFGDKKEFSTAVRNKRDPMTAEEQLRSVAEQVLNEAKKRAHFEMECLTQMVLLEAKAAARYAHTKPFYVS